MFRNTLIAALCGLIVISAAQAIELEVDKAWVRTAPPKATARVGYLQIHNPSAHVVALLAVTSPQFDKIEMHRTSLHEGMMRMEKVDKIDVPSGGTVHLEPNGYHLMMTGNRLPLATGAQVTLELRWSDGTIQRVIAGVRPNQNTESGEHSHDKPHSDHHR